MTSFCGTKKLWMAAVCGLVATYLFLPGCGSADENAIVKVERPAPDVIVYGRDTCGITTATRSTLDDEQIRYEYKDLENGKNEIEMWKKVFATSWFQGDSVGLPVVDVKGTVMERPSISEIKSALEDT